jgi:RES domain-containing protein
MRVVRLAKRQYAGLDGNGAAIIGGRWNSKGKLVAYTASCGALAVVEYLAHLSGLPKGLMLMLEVPSVLVPRQKNYLINPQHPLFGAIKIIERNPFAFDKRLLAALSLTP